MAAFARSQGLIVTETNAARRRVVVSGMAAQMSRAFAVELGRYESPTETHRGYDGYLNLPNDVADLVVSVCGLDNRRVGGRDTMPNSDPPGSFPLDVLTVANRYNFPSSPAPSQTIGIFAIGNIPTTPSFPHGGGFDSADIDQYFTNLNSVNGTNLSAPTIDVVQGTTARNDPGVPQRDLEITQDICVASTVAQKAKIAVYFETDTPMGWLDFLQRAIPPADTDTSKPTVISISAHVSRQDDRIDGFSMADIMTFESLLQAATMRGITVFVSSGDFGAKPPPLGQQPPGTTFKVHWPASSPWVTACCAGTTIGRLNPTDTQPVEWVWNDSSGATGGGVSDRYPLPPYQQPELIFSPPIVPPSLKDGHKGRAIPDVAGNASASSGYQLTVAGQPFVAQGTSIVAPLYAGLAAVINQNLPPFIFQGQSIPVVVGFLNPILYRFTGVCNDINDQLFTGAPPDNGQGDPSGTNNH